MKRSDPQFPECPECRFFSSRRPSPVCRKCGIGEYFEELLAELDPARDTMSFRSSRRRDHDDDE